MTKEAFESFRRGLAQALRHIAGEDVGCVVHTPGDIRKRAKRK